MVLVRKRLRAAEHLYPDFAEVCTRLHEIDNGLDTNETPEVASPKPGRCFQLLLWLPSAARLRSLLPRERQQPHDCPPANCKLGVPLRSPFSFFKNFDNVWILLKIGVNCTAHRGVMSEVQKAIYTDDFPDLSN